MENDEMYNLEREIFRIAEQINKAHKGAFTLNELADIVRRVNESLEGLCIGIGENTINSVTADGKHLFFETVSADFLKSVTNAKEGDVIVFIETGEK